MDRREGARVQLTQTACDVGHRPSGVPLEAARWPLWLGWLARRGTVGGPARSRRRVAMRFDSRRRSHRSPQRTRRYQGVAHGYGRSECVAAGGEERDVPGPKSREVRGAVHVESAGAGGRDAGRHGMRRRRDDEPRREARRRGLRPHRRSHGRQERVLYGGLIRIGPAVLTDEDDAPTLRRKRLKSVDLCRTERRPRCDEEDHLHIACHRREHGMRAHLDRGVPPPRQLTPGSTTRFPGSGRWSDRAG